MALSAPIAAAGLGDNTIVAAVAGKKIRVKAWSVSNLTATAQAIKWRSGTTDLTGLWGLGAAIGLIGQQQAWDTDFLFETAAGQALVLNLAAATAVGGVVQYTLE
jgi:lipoprotein signal peptidase